MEISLVFIFPSLDIAYIFNIDKNKSLVEYIDSILINHSTFKAELQNTNLTKLEFYHNQKEIKIKDKIITWCPDHSKNNELEYIEINIKVAGENRICANIGKEEADKHKKRRKELIFDSNSITKIPLESKSVINGRLNVVDDSISIIKREITESLFNFILEQTTEPNTRIAYIKGPMGVGKSNSIAQVVSSLRQDPSNRVIYFGDCGLLTSSDSLVRLVGNICFCISLFNDTFAIDYWFGKLINQTTIELFFINFFKYCNLKNYAFYFIMDQYNEFAGLKAKGFPFNIVEDFFSVQMSCEKGLAVVSSSSNLDHLLKPNKAKTYYFNKNFNDTEFEHWFKLNMSDIPGSYFSNSKEDIMKQIKDATSLNPLELSKFLKTLSGLKSSNLTFKEIVGKHVCCRIDEITLDVMKYSNSLSMTDRKWFLNAISYMKLGIPLKGISPPPLIIIQDQIMYKDFNETIIKTISNNHFQVLTSFWDEEYKKFILSNQ